MAPEDAVVQVLKQLTEHLKGNLTADMGESIINQLNKLDAMLNTAAKKLRQQKGKQHLHPG